MKLILYYAVAPDTFDKGIVRLIAGPFHDYYTAYMHLNDKDHQVAEQTVEVVI